MDQLGSWKRTHFSIEIKPRLKNKEVIVFGWVEDIRDLGGISFITLRDRSGTVQVTILKKNADESLISKVNALGRQYPVGIRGVVKASKQAPGGVEVIPKDIKILGEATHPLPLDPTGRVPAEIDVRLDSRILDLRRVETRAIFAVRNRVLAEVENFLRSESFMEVHTPKIIGSAAEGGAALFSVEFFGHKAYLAQSPELYKEELTSAFEKVYEIGTYFRAEESHTRRHLNEFVSIDVEQAFATMDDVMDVQERMIVHIISHVTKVCKRELEILKVKLKAVKRPFKRLTYDRILEEIRSRNVDIKWGEDISTQAYRALSDLHNEEFYWITDWPRKLRPFYIKPRDDNAELTYAFDLMYEWVEINSGGSRVDEKKVFLERLAEQGLDPKSFQSHIKVYDYGFPPHAGFGMGLDRFMMAILKMNNIREVVLFPRDRFRLIP